jgi:SAM-dependent methyltransferase
MSDLKPCPLCNSTVNRISDRRWLKDGFDIARCPSCGLMFRFDLPTRAELDAIYGDGYFNAADGETHGQGYQDYIGDETLHRLNARRRLATLETLKDSKGRLLDVGAAAGFFVHEARRAGWDAVGIDVAQSMTRHARERVGVDVATATLAEATIDDASLDAVTLWDYIEHATDPVQDLGRAADSLRPGGVIGLSTGDAASPVARISASRWHLLTPRHHNFFFTPATLAMALERTGFELITVRHPGSVYPVSYLVHKLQTFARLSLLERAAARLRGTVVGGRSVPLNLGDIMTVWARRR